MAFALKGNAERITLVKKSEEAERMWFIIHSDQGPYAVCTWYRRPAPGEVESISSLRKEWEETASTVREPLQLVTSMCARSGG